MKLNFHELFRYIINGLTATSIHFGVLTFNLNVLAIPSAGVANLLAALFGITASFLGSRYFVFPDTDGPILDQVLKFLGLYAAIAVLHGVVLLVWTDWLGMDYRIGFLMATFLQMSLSYLGNKRLVFNV